MTWVEDARRRIAEVTRDIPADATIAQRRKALRAAGPLFHGNTCWGRKAWGRAGREYLAEHGGPPVPARPTDIAKLTDRITSGDVHFPFREAQP